jgi:uncharacterized protein (TIGR02996 family)
MQDFLALLDDIARHPGDGPRWLALASWLADHGRPDEAAGVRVFWPTLRNYIVEDGMSVDVAFAEVTGHARLLGELARQVEREKKAD